MKGLLTSVASHLVQLDIRLAFMVFREAAWSRRCSLCNSTTLTRQFLAPASRDTTHASQLLQVATVVARTLEITAQQTIDIPRILVVPQGEVRAGFKEFQLDLSNVTKSDGDSGILPIR